MMQQDTGSEDDGEYNPSQFNINASIVQMTNSTNSGSRLSFGEEKLHS